MFADDTKLLNKKRNITDGVDLQEDLDAVMDWSNMWLIMLSEEKCKAMHFGRANDHIVY